MTNRPPELVIDDPHDQPNLVDRIPDGIGPVAIVNFYHYRFWPQKRAYCAKCHGRRHRDGFTIELEDGTLALTGSKCGSDLWGEQWRVVRRTFQSKLHKAGIILDVRDVLSELEDIRATLEADWRPVVHQIQGHLMHFKTGPMAAFYKSMQRIDHSKIESWVYSEIGNLPQQFVSALSQLDSAIAAGHGHVTELGVRTVNIGEARDQLDAIAHAARGLRNFFAQEGYSLIQTVWAVNDLIGWSRYNLDAHGRKVVDKLTEASIGLPNEYPVLNTDPLRRLRDLKS